MIRFGDVFSDESAETSVWIMDKAAMRVQSENPQVVARITRWNFSRDVAWGVNRFVRVFEMPRKKWKWVLRELAIKGPEKAIRRVAQGHRMAVQRLRGRPICSAEDRFDRLKLSNIKKRTQ
jgi:hypothetical protein